MSKAVHVATYMVGDDKKPVFPLRHRPPGFYDIIIITKICKGRWHSLLRRSSVSKLVVPFYLFSNINHQVNTRHHSRLSGAHQVVNLSTTTARAQMRLMILRGDSWLPFYVMS